MIPDGPGLLESAHDPVDVTLAAGHQDGDRDVLPDDRVEVARLIAPQELGVEPEEPRHAFLPADAREHEGIGPEGGRDLEAAVRLCEVVGHVAHRLIG